MPCTTSLDVTDENVLSSAQALQAEPLAVNTVENECLLSLHVCGFATEPAQIIQLELHVVTNLHHAAC